jgi:hypothetical protein
MKCRTAILALTLLLNACSVETDGEAKQKCRDLVKDWCSKAIGCFVDRGELPASGEASELDDCRQTGESTIECESAVSTSDRYDECMSTVHAVECSQVGADAKLPSECKGVIEISN